MEGAGFKGKEVNQIETPDWLVVFGLVEEKERALKD